MQVLFRQHELMPLSSFLALAAAVFAAAFAYGAVMPLLPELLAPLLQRLFWRSRNSCGKRTSGEPCRAFLLPHYCP